MSGSLKLPGWKQQEMPSVEMCKRLRQYVVEAVYAQWNSKKKASTLLGIFCAVDERIAREWQTFTWPHKWGRPSKRTIDRRVNNAADPRFYEDNTPKIVAVTAGKYQPNPKLFQQEASPDATVEQLNFSRPKRLKYQKTDQPFRGRPKTDKGIKHGIV